jgi:hypothetical protein
MPTDATVLSGGCLEPAPYVKRPVMKFGLPKLSLSVRGTSVVLFPFVAWTDKQIVGQNHLNTSHAGSGREMPIIVDEDDRPSNNNKSNIMKLQAKIREIVEVYFFCLRAMYILVHS